jgi:hypothetical protein
MVEKIAALLTSPSTESNRSSTAARSAATEVDLSGEHVVAWDLGHHSLRPFEIYVRHNDIRALIREPERERAADSLCPASDDDRASCE